MIKELVLLSSLVVITFAFPASPDVLPVDAKPVAVPGNALGAPGDGPKEGEDGTDPENRWGHHRGHGGYGHGGYGHGGYGGGHGGYGGYGGGYGRPHYGG